MDTMGHMKPTKKKANVHTTFRIREELLAPIRAQAEKEDRSIRSIIEGILRQHIDEKTGR